MSGRSYLQVRKTRLTPAPTTYNLTFYHYYYYNYYHHHAPSLTEEIFYGIATGLLNRADLGFPSALLIPGGFDEDSTRILSRLSPAACRLAPTLVAIVTDRTARLSRSVASLVL